MGHSKGGQVGENNIKRQGAILATKKGYIKLKKKYEVVHYRYVHYVHYTYHQMSKQRTVLITQGIGGFGTKLAKKKSLEMQLLIITNIKK